MNKNKDLLKSVIDLAALVVEEKINKLSANDPFIGVIIALRVVQHIAKTAPKDHQDSCINLIRTTEQGLVDFYIKRNELEKK